MRHGRKNAIKLISEILKTISRNVLKNGRNCDKIDNIYKTLKTLGSKSRRGYSGLTEQSGAGLPAEKKMHAEGTNACEYAVEMIGITKRFPGIVANDNITLQLKKGEIHALLGENGAGKSTLMSVLFGLYHPEEGEIRKDGKTVEINDPNDANALGIGMVHQHFKLVEIFSVLDNIILGVEPTNSAGFLKKTEARRRVVELSEKYGLRIEPDALISDITVGMQQRTEILKMLYRNNEILIFDEPTAVLTPQEIDELMEIMRSLAAEGKSILFISHKLNEIMAVADRCTVLRVDIDHFDLAEIALLQKLADFQIVALDIEVFGAVPVLALCHARAQRLPDRFVGFHDCRLLADPCELVCLVAVHHVRREHLFQQLKIDCPLDPAVSVRRFGDAVREQSGNFFYVFRC